MTATTKRNLNYKQAEAWNVICDFSNRAFVEAQIIENYQMRIRNNKVMIDIYPKSKKYAIWKNGSKRPTWKIYENLEQLLDKTF